MKKTDMNKQKKRTALLDAAYHLFLEKGFAQTTIADIVDAAGVAKGTFYLYFTDKYDLRNRVTASKAYHIFEQAWDALPPRHRMSFDEQMVFVVDQILDQLASDESLTRFLERRLGEALLISPSEGSPTGMDLFLARLDASDYSCRTPEILICLVVEMAGSAGYSAIVNGHPTSLEELRPYLRETIQNMVHQFRSQSRHQNDLPVELL